LLIYRVIQGSSIEIGHLNNVYDQITYDTIDTHTTIHGLSINYADRMAPYTPIDLSDESPTEQDSHRLPITPVLMVKEVAMPNKSQLISQCNTKRELHKELIYRQRMCVDKRQRMIF
jgi:hypothetical protein